MAPTLDNIRLIVTDMDGTLLDGARQLPKNFKTALQTLEARGIHWAIASGRQLANLQDLFAIEGIDLDIIGENGAIAQLKGAKEPFFKDLTPATTFKDILTASLTIPGATPVLCGPFNAWIHDAYPSDHPIVRRYFSHADTWHQFEEIQSVEICKIAIYHPQAAEALWPTLSPYNSADCKVIISSDHWIDIQLGHIHKGNGLKALLQARGLAPEQAVVFGDYLNDVEMMTLGTHAVAMANSHPDLKAICAYTTLANTEDGVLHYLRQGGLL
jgi:Cof subfamily protein (haloacid dehalogenase superfamily)